MTFDLLAVLLSFIALQYAVLDSLPPVWRRAVVVVAVGISVAFTVLNVLTHAVVWVMD